MSHIIHVISSSDLASKCCREAGIWYYRILERLASQERKRLGVNDIPVSVLPRVELVSDKHFLDTRGTVGSVVLYYIFMSLCVSVFVLKRISCACVCRRS